jgi:hypothetical protein
VVNLVNSDYATVVETVLLVAGRTELPRYVSGQFSARYTSDAASQRLLRLSVPVAATAVDQCHNQAQRSRLGRMRRLSR